MSDNLCGSIANLNPVAPNCDRGSVTGMESFAYIYDRDDWLLAAPVFAADKMTITSFTLPVGKIGFLAQTTDAYMKGRFAGEIADSGQTLFTHGQQLLVNKDLAGKIFTDNAAKGRYVLVVETRWKGIDNADAFHVYGATSGLKALPTYDSDANSGMILVDFQSTAAEESKVPYTFLNTDYATSKAFLDATLTA